MNEQQPDAIVAIPIFPTIFDGLDKLSEVAIASHRHRISITTIANIAGNEKCYE